jgi:hypothetical protein
VNSNHREHMQHSDDFSLSNFTGNFLRSTASKRFVTGFVGVCCYVAAHGTRSIYLPRYHESVITHAQRCDSKQVQGT